MKIVSPVYLVRSAHACWKCGDVTPVVALAVTHFVDEDPLCEAGEPVLLEGIEDLPSELLQAVKARHLRYEKRFSKTAETPYFMNVCSCGAHFGDFYLFSEPGGAFFPSDDNEAQQITIEELPVKGEWELTANYSVGTGAQIFEHGKRVESGAGNQ